MTHLYELAEAYKTLLETEELTDEQLAESLKSIQDIFTQKALNIGKLVLSLQSDAEAIGTEIIRLSQRKVALENRVRNIKNYLSQEMAITQTDKIKNEILTISLRISPPSVQVIDEKAIPANFWRVIPEQREVDKQAILIAYKESGAITPGTEIITNKKYVQIR